MPEKITLKYAVDGDDFTKAGLASSDLKHTLKQIGYDPGFIRRVAIAVYEGEINMVIHAGGGEITADIAPDKVEVWLADSGPGIPNVELAMREGYSTAPIDVHELGFGAGMGLPNIKKYTDDLQIDTTVGVGTTVYMLINNN
ncbi:MAG: ATP-binding protein [Oscillospiraceae bacterium]|nr:ATP-binding protein [Oscillospiraceae bacterium]